MDAARRVPVLLLSTGCLFHLPLAVIAETAARAGFDGLELIVNDPGLVPGPGLESVDRICRVRSLHAPFRNWSRWGGHLAAWRATVALANALPEAGQVTLHPPGESVADVIRARWFAKAQDLPLLLDARGRVRLSLENLPWGEGTPFGPDPLDELLETCRTRKLGLTLDVCHLGVSGRDPLAVLERLPEGIIENVHFSDARGWREHLFPGQGTLPLQGVLERLAWRGYSRYITVEVQPGALPDSPAQAAGRLAELRGWMEETLASRLTEEARP